MSVLNCMFVSKRLPTVVTTRRNNGFGLQQRQKQSEECNNDNETTTTTNNNAACCSHLIIAGVRAELRLRLREHLLLPRHVRPEPVPRRRGVHPRLPVLFGDTLFRRSHLR